MKTSTAPDWSRYPGLPFAFPFEANFDQKFHRQWFKDNWTISIKISLVYIAAVLIGRRAMANREPFNLRGPLALWSLILTIFSFIGALRIVPDLIAIVTQKGLAASACENSFPIDIRKEFWLWAFVVSKAFELVDTLFIVLRKQKLIFLHWYHHFATLTYCFYAIGERASSFRWFAGMNFTIHTIMYGYYALKAMRFRIPSIISMFITVIQITQMVIGLVITVYAYFVIKSGHKCDISESAAFWGMIIYLSFLILFANFFVKSYLVKSCSQEPQLRTKVQ